MMNVLGRLMTKGEILNTYSTSVQHCLNIGDQTVLGERGSAQKKTTNR